ncbi:L-piperidine-6-carboxylate dehydrogenase [Steroidobacter agaridevorans]|uniref:L-piperidine-6-carboxylate dehydrogenase n=1 Tax=Steroidobacter agaridevorans TaxID=2695856 RepID=UPI00132A92D8|nr:aldehyde dehydrogenase family protein [Steroidobacter agaridevorans]GFE86628.1 aldehyde dehydrogenase [Steroidobacter agaridevorans]
MRELFSALDLNETNAGAWSGDGWSNDTSGPLIDSVNPTTGDLLGRVRGATVADYERILVSSRRVFDQWKVVPAPKRGEAIRLVSEELRKHKSALGSLVTLEVGKIKAEGDGEVQEMIDIGDFAVGQSRMLYGQTMHSERPFHRMYEQWHPLGVVGIISAFNFPVAVWSWNAFLAAICGDVSIWKPSPKAPLCAVAVQKLVNRVLERHGFPGIFQLLIAGNDLAEKLVDDRRVDLVSFTGSTAVGRKVGERVAARLGKSLLELGGNNGIIVDEFANLDLAVPSIVFGAVGTAGQRCTSTRRVFVHESRSKELEQRLLRAYSQVRIGDPLKSETLMGPLIDEASVQRYLQAIDKAQRAGGTVLCGGKAKPPGNFVEPTIIRARADWEIVQTETFAPILYLIEYQSLDEAIALHNSSHHGLSSAIFTDNVRHAERFLSALGSDCGIANVNIGTSGAEIGGAFGGEKDTGGGRESGSDSWKAYMRRQTNTINWSRELPLAQGIDFKVMG